MVFTARDRFPSTSSTEESEQGVIHDNNMSIKYEIHHQDEELEEDLEEDHELKHDDNDESMNESMGN